MKKQLGGLCAAAVLVGLCVPGAVFGTVTHFEVNPVQSQFSLTGTLRGPDGLFPILQPTAGSLRTNYEGLVYLDSDLGQTEFRGGNVDAQVDGEYLPGPEESDYGLAWATPGGTTFGAFRDFAFNLRGLAAPLSSGFDLSTVLVEVTSGTLETTRWSSTVLSGGQSTFVSGNGTLFAHDTGDVLNLPLTAAFSEQITGTPYVLEYVISGIIVATQVFPEPGTLGLLAWGAVLTIGRRRTTR